MTGQALAFIYACMATPFLVWAFFRYTETKSQKTHNQRLEKQIASLNAMTKKVEDGNLELVNEINSIKLKAGFGVRKKAIHT